jgi:hypothetical protein
VPTPSVPPAAEPGGPGSLRARLRLAGVVLLGALALLYAVLAIRLYFFSTANLVLNSLVGVVLAVLAVVYALLTRAVARRSRVGHLVAVAVCVVAAVLAIVPVMAWPDWLAVVANLAAAGALLGSVPRRLAA